MQQKIREDYLKAYYQNEYDANKQMVYALAFTGGILTIFWILFMVPSIFKLTQMTRTIILIVLPIIIIILFTPLFWIKTERYKKPRFKFFVLYAFIFAMGILNIFIPKHAIIGWAICIALANHYYNPKVGLWVYITTILTMFVCIYTAMFIGEYDANLLTGELSTKTGILTNNALTGTYYDTPAGRFNYLKDLIGAGYNRFISVFIYYYLTRATIITILFFVSNALNKRTYKLLVQEIEVTNKHVNQSKELEIAGQIQLSALPDSFESNKDIEIIANLKPAREVGGDFYDYYNLDNNHVAIVIGDVSGKGTPAAMFMMKTITCFKNFTRFGKKPSEILDEVNHAIYDHNKNEMFVTCFLAILDIESGIMTYANAGHNPPIIYRKDHFEYLKCYSGFILGGMDQVFVKDEQIKLEKGDLITLYTDGITEARNVQGDFYGEKRLLDVYNKQKYESVIDLHYELKDDLEAFINDFEQSDDQTYLTLKYKGGEVTYKEIELQAEIPNVKTVCDMVSSVLEENRLSNQVNKFKIVIDEIFSNIAKYAYPENANKFVYVRVFFNKESKYLSLTFIDKGIEFNQLEKDSNLIDEDYQNRQEGGLGIHIVKQFIDSYSYARINGKNILVLKKKMM